MIVYSTILALGLSTILALEKQYPFNVDQLAKFVRYENTNDGKGNYHFLFETTNGIFREETGEFRDGILRVHGGSSYYGDDGNKYAFDYATDENGFQHRTLYGDVVEIHSSNNDSPYNSAAAPIPSAAIGTLQGGYG